MTEEGLICEGVGLDFSCAKIEISLRRGEDFEGSFRIFADGGQFTEGRVQSSDLRMECLTKEFTGCDEEILFCFHGGYLEEGDVVEGDFCVISNQGEYRLPFAAAVEREAPDSSAGPVRSLFHFASLAKNSWQEAVKLFYTAGFERILSGEDGQYVQAYRALSVYPGMEQNVEEFLILTGRKQKAEFLVQEEALTFTLGGKAGSDEVMEGELTILLNGWGCTRLFVECEGDFLFTEKEIITDDDFLGNRCLLPVFVDGKLCREGRNYGRLFLYNSFVSLSVPVTVQVGEAGGRDPRTAARKRCSVRLMECYQAFRGKKISMDTWLQETGRLVEKLAAMDENDISARLFQAQLLITRERFREAGWILDHVAALLEKGDGNETLRAYYLYLNTLTGREQEDVDRAVSELEHIYRLDNGNWRVAWLILYLSEEYRGSAARKWLFLEKQYKAGSNSPVLYIEAVALLNANPTFLRRLGGFERQVLWYGARKELLQAEVTEQMLYLADRTKEYSEVMYRTLCRLYEREKDAGILRQICALLIKGARTDSRYFEWYRLGVENNLRITNLYEYYMMAMDLESRQEIPKAALMYFSYQNSLDYEHTAFLYNYIQENADRLKDIYDTYAPRMERFCAEQISKGHINRQLAAIYNRMLGPELVTEQTCGPLSSLLFTHLIRVADERIRNVYVCQPGSLDPARYPVSGGEAKLPLYGGDSVIVFEDAWNNRYIRSVEYTIEELVRPEKCMDLLRSFPVDNLEWDYYLYRGEQDMPISSLESAARARRLAEFAELEKAIRRGLVLKLLRYYHEMDASDALDQCLIRMEPARADQPRTAPARISPEHYTGEERSAILRYIVLRGHMDLAGRWLRAYGPYGIDAGLLVRILGHLMEQGGMAEDETLTASAVYAFEKGKYDSTLLRYLTMHCRGTAEILRDVWKAARSFGIDCRDFSEAILTQMLYTGSSVEEEMEIFQYYVSQGAKPAVEEAFLARYAYEYFVRERPVQSDVFEEIGRMCRWGEPVRKVCKLAFLKYYAQHPDQPGEGAAELSERFLNELTEQGVCLEFFRECGRGGKAASRMADRAVVEYRAAPGARPCIHYALQHEDGETEEYRAEQMREVCDGVFARAFVLFSGESIRYHITQEFDGEERQMESGILQKNEAGGDVGSGRTMRAAESRYHLINEIVRSRAMGEWSVMESLLEEYYRREFLNRKLFELK